MSKHTPGPFGYYQPEGYSGFFYIDQKNIADDRSGIGNFAACSTGDETSAKANAEFIVRACNSHYELLEALEAVTINSHRQSEKEAYEMAQKAIAKARGQS